MSLRKQPKQFETEELLEIIEDTSNPEVLEQPTEHSVIQFLADFGIYPGTNKVRDNILYKLYKQCTKNPVPAVEFNLLLQGYLQYEQMVKYRNYMVNKEPKDLTNQLARFLVKKKKIKKTNLRFYRKHIESFIAVHNIKKGSKPIPAAALYYFFDKWQYEGKTGTKFRFKEFTGMMKLYFKTKTTPEVWCYFMIDTEFYKQPMMETALGWAKKFNGNYDQRTIVKKEKSKAYNQKKKSQSQK